MIVETIIYIYTYIDATDTFYVFPSCQVWKKVDSQHYGLRQRRCRVWGLAVLNTGGGSKSDLNDRFDFLLHSMQSNFQFPMSEVFQKKTHEKPKEGRHDQLVKFSRNLFAGNPNVFVDCSTSLKNHIHAADVCTCITPGHPVYSTELKRYLTGRDFLMCQGLWPSCWSSDVFQWLVSDPKFAQDIAGNSFSSTVCQAVVLAMFGCGQDAWKTLTRTVSAPLAPPAQPPAAVRRVRSKRPAPEFDHLVKHPPNKKEKKEPNPREIKLKRKRAPHYKRKVPGVDGRTKQAQSWKPRGKKPMVSIWQKEML